MTPFRGIWIAAIAFVLGLTASTQPVQAQQWAQNVQIVTSVKSEQPTRAFLDSLVTELKNHRDTIRVRREPSGERIPLDSLQSTLLDRGLGVFSANRLFISYGFQIRDNQFIEVIQGMQFIFRPQGSGQEDVPVLYVSGSNPITKEILTSEGISNPENLEAVTLFKDELSFASLSLDQGADIVAVGGSPIRGEFDQRRKDVLERFKRFIYRRDKVYVTRVQ